MVRKCSTRGKKTTLSRKAAGMKKNKMIVHAEATDYLRMKRRVTEQSARSPSPAPSGTSSDEASSSIASDDAGHAKASAFDYLLTTLGSGKASVAAAYKKRKREHKVESDSEEDENESSESSGVSDKKEFSSGSDSDTSSRQTEGNEAKERRPADLVKQSEEAEIEDDAQTSDSDNDNDSGNTGGATVSGSLTKSSFHAHLERSLTKAEVDGLMKRAWKYKWETPAFDLEASKWKGTGECFSKEVDNDIHYGLKPKLYKHWLDLFKKSRGGDFSSSWQRHFFLLCNSYRDIMHCNKKPFYLKGQNKDSCIMDAYIMHALNHVFKTRSLVTKNDAKLGKNQDRSETEMLHGGSFLDRGFTRPKVLFLLPFRSIALRVVRRLIQLTPPSHKTNLEHFDRFCSGFGTGDDKEEPDMEALSNRAHYDEGSKSHESTKPADYQVLFGGNSSEEFMLGIKFTRRSIKLFSDFYSSDIIVASPVQLMQAIAKAEAEKERDVDYLSSIEVLIIDHADIIAMQNWSHVNSILEQLNQIPFDQHGTDVMRVRPWYLDGHARFFRQTILLGSFLNPDMNASFNNLCVNYEGKVKLVSDHKGVLPKARLPIFYRFEAPSVADEADARFDYFTKKEFPKIKDSIQGGIMIFISSYFDFVRIRNFLKSQNASFCLLGEYTKQADISRARGWFFQGKRKIMLYTERAHFYHRYKIRGVQNLIFYSLPERKEFYSEIINMLAETSNPCSVLFSRFDKLQLERIVGSANLKDMLSPEKSMFTLRWD